MFRISGATHPLSYMPSWHAQAQLHLSHTKFSHKYFSTVHTTGHVSGVTVVTHNFRFCVFFLFHFNATIMVAYSLLQACVVLTKCGTCQIQVRWNFISLMLQVKPFFFHTPLFCPPLNLYTDKNDGGSTVTPVQQASVVETPKM